MSDEPMSIVIKVKGISRPVLRRDRVCITDVHGRKYEFCGPKAAKFEVKGIHRGDELSVEIPAEAMSLKKGPIEIQGIERVQIVRNRPPAQTREVASLR